MTDAPELPIMVPVTVHLPENTIGRVNRAARRWHISPEEFARSAIYSALDRFSQAERVGRNVGAGYADALAETRMVDAAWEGRV